MSRLYSWKNMKLTGKTIAYFVCVLIVCSIGFGLIINDSSDTKLDVTSVYEEEIPRLLMGTDMRKNVLIEIASVRAYLITKDESYINAYLEASKSSAKITEELTRIARSDFRKKTLQEISALDNKYSQIIDGQVIPRVKAGDMAGAVAANTEAASVATTLIDKIGAITNDSNETVNSALKHAIDSANNTVNIAIASAIISFIIGIAIAVYSAKKIAGPVGSLSNLAQKIADGDLTQSYTKPITQDEVGDLAVSINTMVHNLKSIIGQINSQSQQVAASSEELTASADQSAQASNQVAGSITEVAYGTEKQMGAVKSANNVAETMVAELEEVASNVTMVADRAVKAAETATAGGKSAERAIEQMREVERTVSDSAAVVAQLGERSKEIGQIVDTISGISGQTNLLALNAAIEAARAGDQGRGFAVVAEEVRKLAEQSQEAAKRIADLIGEIQNETSRAVAAMDNGTREVKIGADVVNETGLSFKEIVDLIDQVSEQVKGIAKVVQHVANGSEQIMHSVENINSLSAATVDEIQTVSAATEEQSASMEEIASASQNLAKMAQEMQAVVAKFSL